MNILLTSHGSVCAGFLNAFSMFGTVEHIHTVDLTDTGIDDFRGRLTAVITELLDQGKLLILADLVGGTPYNESYALAIQNPEAIRLVGGMNFPMLLEAGVLAMSCDDLDEVASAAVSAGLNGISLAKIPEDSVDAESEDELF